MKNVLMVTVAVALWGCGSAATTQPDAPSGADPARGESARGESDSSAAAPSSPAGADAAAPAGADQCEHLAKLCHDHAGANPLVADCHKIGHAGDAATCQARHDECRKACAEAAEGGKHPHPEGGPGHH